jgi:hypothetical protein
MDAYLTKHMHNLHIFIDRWRGGEAMIWTYSVSHRKLVVRVQQEGRRGNLHITCGEVQFIHGPTKWLNSSFEVVYLPEKDEYLLRDRKADFEVWAGIVGVAENCKPIF